MSTIIDEDNKLLKKLKNLDLLIQGDAVFILPSNIDTEDNPGEFAYTEKTTDLIKHFTSEGLNTQKIYKSNKSIVQQGIDLWIPPILVTADTLSKDPNFLSICTGILGSYIVDFLKKIRTNPQKKHQDVMIHSEVIVERNGEVKRARYQGPAESFETFTDMITKL